MWHRLVCTRTPTSILTFSSSFAAATTHFTCTSLFHLRRPFIRSYTTPTRQAMNVTKANFADACKQLADILPTASYVAIDLEMTGIHIPGVVVEKADDTPNARYGKMKTVAEYYRIIQAGLCVFHREESSTSSSSSSSADPAQQPTRYTARPYNFYLFPESGQVNMEAEAIAFNREHGMNFNKWIYDGITYVTEEQELALREKFYGVGEGWEKEEKRREGKVEEKKDDSSSSSSPAPNGNERKKKTITLEREGDIQFLDGVKAQVAAWLATRSTADHELLLPECNSFLRLAVHQWFDQAFSEASIAAQPSLLPSGTKRDDLFLETRPVPGQKWKNTFVLCCYSAEERAALDVAAATKKRRDFDAKLGFKIVWNLLREAKKPIIIHNGFYDVLFLWTHFESAKLPETLIEFKKALYDRFPAGVYDTKYLSNSRQFLFPMEHLAKKAKEMEEEEEKSGREMQIDSSAASSSSSSKLSSSQRARIAAFKKMQITPEHLNICRFRETHLEKLYLALKRETDVRNGVVATTATSSSAAPTQVQSPPTPYGAIALDLASGFDKYALIGTPGGDESAAHEAGYDAYMTGVIFAHLIAEAPDEEITTPMKENKTSKWRNRIGIFRHAMCLVLEIDENGVPLDDTLVDQSSTIYLMKSLSPDTKTEDIQKWFEKYASSKRKMDDAQTTSNKAGGDDAAMTDVDTSSSAAAASSTAAPSTSVVRAAPKIQWIDDTSVFFSVPAADTASMDEFLANVVNIEQAAGAIPVEVQISKFAEPTSVKKQ